MPLKVYKPIWKPNKPNKPQTYLWEMYATFPLQRAFEKYRLWTEILLDFMMWMGRPSLSR